MKYILRNRYFASAVALVVVQQIFVAASSFFIAAAGESISKQDFHILTEIVLFFSAIVFAYLLGATAQWLTVLLANNSWKQYYEDLLNQVAGDYSLASEGNKTLTNTWIAGEALSTLAISSTFLVDFISIYCNIAFTIFTFYKILGVRIALSMSIGLIASVVAIHFARPVIRRLASEIQSGKVKSLVSIQLLWDHTFFGNALINRAAKDRSDRLVEAFIRSSSIYKAMEQAIACAPVFISIPIVVWAISTEIRNEPILIGALVALLPRTLQVFQNFHAALSYAGRFVLFKAKLENLVNFVSTLERHDLSEAISRTEISVRSVNYPNEHLTVESLLGRISRRADRIVITGRNGSGKTSLLRLVKATCPNSVLLGPQVEFDGRQQGSTGEKQLRSVEQLISHGVEVLLLDEWDANLDAHNLALIDKRLESYSRSALIIEVRHRTV